MSDYGARKGKSDPIPSCPPSSLLNVSMPSYPYDSAVAVSQNVLPRLSYQVLNVRR